MEAEAEAVAAFARELSLLSSSDEEPEREPEPEPEREAHLEPEPEPELEAHLEPEREPERCAGALADALLEELPRAAGPARWLAACERLAALGSSSAAVLEFRKRGGMRRLTALLRAAAELPDAAAADALLQAATAAIASCGSAAARPQRRTFELGDGIAVHVQELRYEAAGTGHAVWSAAMLQARWLCEHRRELCAVRTALELGAGLGLRRAQRISLYRCTG